MKEDRKPKTVEYIDLFPETHRDDPVFVAWWEKWKEHNRAKKKPLTPGRAETHAKKLAAVSVSVACGMIETAIDRGWQSVFPPKEAEPYHDDLQDFVLEGH